MILVITILSTFYLIQLTKKYYANSRMKQMAHLLKNLSDYGVKCMHSQ